MSANLASRVVRKLYQRNQLVKGGFRLNGSTVQLSEITCPLLMWIADRSTNR
ncbi:hypothetical protein [Novipirellula rosea]|uniref:hypothetical protein n=1 Tax=Novipirellula rosea TaxID=1031540 RepID=UPI0031EBD55D